MTEEQLIQEYGDCIYPRIAKALISETKQMTIDKACKWLRIHLPRVFTFYPDAEHTIDEMLNEDFRKKFKQAMEE